MDLYSYLLISLLLAHCNRWHCRKSLAETPLHVLSYYRRHLDRLKKSEVCNVVNNPLIKFIITLIDKLNV